MVQSGKQEKSKTWNVLEELKIKIIIIKQQHFAESMINYPSFPVLCFYAYPKWVKGCEFYNVSGV